MNLLFHETFGSGRRLVMIHGWAMHSGVWRSWAQSLSKNFRVTLVDLPGHGKSPSWAKVSLENIVESLAKSVANEKVTWLGWSLGGLIALELARQYPQLTSSVVLVASNPSFIAKQNWPGVSQSWFDQFQNELIEDTNATLRRFIAMVGGNKPHIRQLRVLWNQYPAPSLETLLQSLALLASIDGRGTLPILQCPVSFMTGDNDPLVPVSVVQSISALTPNCCPLVLENTGHVPFLSHSEQMTRALMP